MRSYTARMKLENSAGVVVLGSAPWFITCARTSGELITVDIVEQDTVRQIAQALNLTPFTGTSFMLEQSIRPTILTSYQAHWKTTSSLSVAVNVRPLVHLSASHGYGFVKVRTASSLKGKSVFIQRFTRFHQWVTMRRVVLGNNSSKLFHIRLKRGRHMLRAFVPAKQAGPGYLDGLSKTVKYRRK